MYSLNHYGVFQIGVYPGSPGEAWSAGEPAPSRFVAPSGTLSVGPPIVYSPSVGNGSIFGLFSAA
jgi:hypothetical protein